MYQKYYILVLCLTILGGSLAAKYENERSRKGIPDWQQDQNNVDHRDGFINIDDSSVVPYRGGSGDDMGFDNNYSDDEDIGMSGDGYEGSADHRDSVVSPEVKNPSKSGGGYEIDPDTDAEGHKPTGEDEEAPGKTDIEIETTSDSTAEDSDKSPHREVASTPTIFGHPGILAGIIGGAVVGLLCAVLFVMFIVYRMRKKDEGSYALDEPKRSPSHGYTRAPTKEFYA